jgi:hypothetical protein
LPKGETPFDPARLIANIRPRSYVDVLKGRAQESNTAIDLGPVYENLAADIVVLYQIDDENKLRCHIGQRWKGVHCMSFGRSRWRHSCRLEQALAVSRTSLAT